MGRQEPQPHRGETPDVLATLLGLAVLALWWDLGAVHAFHNSDTLVPVFGSLWRWTPFYWEEDRFGWLVPALALPFRTPLSNLLAQVFLAAFLGLAGIVFLLRCAMPGGPWLAAGLLAAAATVWGCPPHLLREFLNTGQCYAPALGAGATGLALLAGSREPHPARRAAAALLILLSLWVNTAMAFALLPLALLSRLAAERRSGGFRSEARSGEAWGAATAVTGALLVWCVVRPLLRRHWYALVPIADLPAAWSGLANSVYRDGLAGGWGWGMALLAGAGLAALPFTGKRRGRSRLEILGPAAALLCAAEAYIAGIGTSEWIRGNGWNVRYTLPVLALLCAAAAALAARAWAAVQLRPVFRGMAVPLAALLLAAGIAVRAGPPSLAGVRAALDRTLGARTGVLLGRGVTHLTGDYSLVWTAVFHANLVLAGRGGGRTLWAITERCGPIRALWRAGDPAGWRVAFITADPERRNFLNQYRLCQDAILAREDGLTVVRVRDCRPARPRGTAAE